MSKVKLRGPQQAASFLAVADEAVELSKLAGLSLKQSVLKKYDEKIRTMMKFIAAALFQRLLSMNAGSVASSSV